MGWRFVRSLIAVAASMPQCFEASELQYVRAVRPKARGGDTRRIEIDVARVGDERRRRDGMVGRRVCERGLLGDESRR
ncbi:hypothetical protein BKA80DRAFT_264672 [Phyllosticta citrichinensis]